MSFFSRQAVKVMLSGNSSSKKKAAKVLAKSVELARRKFCELTENQEQLECIHLKQRDESDSFMFKVFIALVLIIVVAFIFRKR